VNQNTLVVWMNIPNQGQKTALNRAPDSFRSAFKPNVEQRSFVRQVS
jgi:hypothetical protein